MLKEAELHDALNDLVGNSTRVARQTAQEDGSGSSDSSESSDDRSNSSDSSESSDDRSNSSDSSESSDDRSDSSDDSSDSSESQIGSTC